MCWIYDYNYDAVFEPRSLRELDEVVLKKKPDTDHDHDHDPGPWQLSAGGETYSQGTNCFIEHLSEPPPHNPRAGMIKSPVINAFANVELTLILDKYTN